MSHVSLLCVEFTQMPQVYWEMLGVRENPCEDIQKAQSSTASTSTVSLVIKRREEKLRRL